MSFSIAGTGSSLPKTCLTNNQLAKKFNIDTSDEWITSRTGIRQRYICAEGETTVTLATDAAKEALQNAGIKAEEIDLIVVGTTTPDHSFPAVAAEVQGALGVSGGAALDVQAACSGFVHSLGVAQGLMETGPYKTALVIGADTYSNLLDWSDRTTCVLFGDGAGAVVLQKIPSKKEGATLPLNLSVELFNDGVVGNILASSGGVATTKTAGSVTMNGKEVYRHAVRRMGEVVPTFLEKNGLSIDDIALMVPHQANQRILDAVAKAAGFPEEKMVVTVDKHANTSAASIPLALHDAVGENRLQKGDIILLLAFGAGLAWSVALLRW